MTVSFSLRQSDTELRFPVMERVRLDVAPDDCLLPVGAPASQRGPRTEPRPQLTMLTTLPLPLDTSTQPQSERPPLRLVSDV